MRLLFLHGYQQSPAIIQEETRFLPAFLTQALGEEVELVHPPAPFPSAKSPTGEQTYSWWREDGGGDEADPDDDHHHPTFAYLSDILDTFGPFDGAIGFSQGACVACLTAAVLERAVEDRPASFVTTAPPFRFVISFSGYHEEDGRVQALYAPGIHTPVLHFINSQDPILDESRCMRLVKDCIDTDGRVVTYNGSGTHRVPGTKMVRGAINRFLEDFVAVEESD